METPNPDALDLDTDDLGDSGCDPNPSVCPPAPLAGCKLAEAGKSSVGIKNDTNDAKDSTFTKSDGEQFKAKSA